MARRVILPTDIVHLDVTVYLNGFHGDTSACVPMPDVDQQGLELIAANIRARDAGIAVCKPGVPFTAIGAAIRYELFASL